MTGTNKKSESQPLSINDKNNNMPVSFGLSPFLPNLLFLIFFDRKAVDESATVIANSGIAEARSSRFGHRDVPPFVGCTGFGQRSDAVGGSGRCCRHCGADFR
jgi:hypothetical protein